MFTRLHIGIQLAKHSFALINQKKSLLFFPTINVLLTVGLLTIAMIPIIKVEKMTWGMPQVTKNEVILCLGILFIFFFIVHVITVLCHAALTACAIKQIKNEPLDIFTGFKIFYTHFSILFVWTLITTSIGIVIRTLEYWIENWSSFKMVTNILAGLTWFIASFFILPVVIAENRELIAAIKQSAHLVKKTWGPARYSCIGTGIVTFFVTLAALLPLIIAILMGGKMSVTICSIITSTLVICISILNSASRTILIAALYLYAKGEDTANFCDENLLRKALRD